jgi:hypothetical protein
MKQKILIFIITTACAAQLAASNNNPPQSINGRESTTRNTIVFSSGTLHANKSNTLFVKPSKHYFSVRLNKTMAYDQNPEKTTNLYKRLLNLDLRLKFRLSPHVQFILSYQ